MTDLDLDPFLDHILPDVPDCPEPLAQQKLIDAAIDFCTRSRIWRDKSDPISFIAGQATYDLEPPDNTLVVDILSADLLQNAVIAIPGWNDIPQPSQLQPKTPKQLDSIVPDWRNTQGVVGFFTQEDPRTFTLAYIPSQSTANALQITWALKPTRATTTLPDLLFEDWLEPLCAGAKARIMMIPGKRFTDPAFAQINAAIFEAGWKAAQRKAAKGNTLADMKVLPRSFGME